MGFHDLRSFSHASCLRSCRVFTVKLSRVTSRNCFLYAYTHSCLASRKKKKTLYHENNKLKTEIFIYQMRIHKICVDVKTPYYHA